MQECVFWLNNLPLVNGKSRIDSSKQTPVVVGYFDAIIPCVGAIIVTCQQELPFHYMWSEQEKGKSSTWRELKALSLALVTLQTQLHHRTVKFFTDSQNAARIVACGWMKTDSQSLALNIYGTFVEYGIRLEVERIPRDQSLLTVLPPPPAPD